MKKIYTIIFVSCLAAISFSSCSDWLDAVSYTHLLRVQVLVNTRLLGKVGYNPFQIFIGSAFWFCIHNC